MKLLRRREGSQRPMAPVQVELVPNTAGMGGSPQLTFRTDAGTYYSLAPETEAEVKELMSQAHIIHHNFGDQ